MHIGLKLLLLSATAALLPDLCVGAVADGGRQVTRTEAITIAREAFIEAFSEKFQSFEIHDAAVQPDRDQWYFFIQAVGKEARPGRHAWVSIDKATGKISLSIGE